MAPSRAPVMPSVQPAAAVARVTRAAPAIAAQVDRIVAADTRRSLQPTPNHVTSRPDTLSTRDAAFVAALVDDELGRSPSTTGRRSTTSISQDKTIDLKDDVDDDLHDLWTVERGSTSTSSVSDAQLFARTLAKLAGRSDPRISALLVDDRGSDVTMDDDDEGTVSPSRLAAGVNAGTSAPLLRMSTIIATLDRLVGNNGSHQQVAVTPQPAVLVEQQHNTQPQTASRKRRRHSAAVGSSGDDRPHSIADLVGSLVRNGLDLIAAAKQQQQEHELQAKTQREQHEQQQQQALDAPPKSSRKSNKTSDQHQQGLGNTKIESLVTSDDTRPVSATGSLASSNDIIDTNDVGYNALGTVSRSTTTPAASGKTNRGKKSGRNKTRITRVQRVPLYPDGRPPLPIQVGVITLRKLGTVVFDRDMYHTNRYLYPVGYEAIRKFYSLQRPTETVDYLCQIEDGGDSPRFIVTPVDNPSGRVESTTATGAWGQIIREVNRLRGRSATNSIAGPDFFGLSTPVVAFLLQKLPNADKCSKYQPTIFEVEEKPTLQRIRIMDEVFVSRYGDGIGNGSSVMESDTQGESGAPSVSAGISGVTSPRTRMSSTDATSGGMARSDDDEDNENNDEGVVEEDADEEEDEEEEEEDGDGSDGEGMVVDEEGGDADVDEEDEDEEDDES